MYKRIEISKAEKILWAVNSFELCKTVGIARLLARLLFKSISLTSLENGKK